MVKNIEIEEYDETKHRAQCLVMDAMKGTSKFKRAVRDTYKMLKQQEKEAKKIVLGQK